MLNSFKKQKIFDLIIENKLDSILIYNSKEEEPSYIPWFLEENIIDNCYLLIKKSGEIIFFIAGWYLDMAKLHYNFGKNIKGVGTYHKKGMLKEIIDYIKNDNIIGIAGDIPYKDFELISNKKTLCIENKLSKIFSIKTEAEIQTLKKVRIKATKILDGIKLIEGMTEKDLSKLIKNEVEKIGFNTSFLSICGYENLKNSTVGFPSDRKINNGECVCIDFGLNKYGYHSDQTRCYFLGDNYLKSKYEFIKTLVKDYQNFIKSGLNSKDVLKEIIKHTENQIGIDEYFFHDLGHSIGSFYHEYPDIYHDEFIYEKGMVFTLEPEYRFGDRLIRYEDMFYINDLGDCICLGDSF